MLSTQSYWQRWIQKRIPDAQEHQLNHRNIFIFPAKFGAFFLFLCALLFLLGTNYQNNLMLLLCYFLLSVFLVNLLASYINFARIHLQIGKCSEVFVQDNVHLPLWLNANSQDPTMPSGLLNFRFKLSKDTAKVKKISSSNNTQVDLDTLTNPVTLSFKCAQRGKLNLPRITVESFYPLGLYRCWTHLAFTHSIMVYPKPIPCVIKLQVNPQTETKGTGQQANPLSGHDDFSHLKPYQLGEPLRHVAWKQLAKGRGMVSKHFSSETNQVGWLILSNEFKNNANRLLTQQQREKLELALSHLSYQVIELSRTDQTFGLDMGAQSIAPNSGASHRKACLNALAVFALNGSE
jgi:uncharacterized protein (DUF58 family)